MAQFQTLFWKHVPSQVKASDGKSEVSKMMPQRFQNAIDAAAMAAGDTDSDDYLDGWHWSDPQERDGSAAEVAQAVVAELDAAMPRIPVKL